MADPFPSMAEVRASLVVMAIAIVLFIVGIMAIWAALSLHVPNGQT